jgi:hypothetical protein
MHSPAVCWDQVFDGLERLRARKRGNKFNPEPPTLVAKVVAAEGRGELWCGGLPRDDLLKQHFPWRRFSIQICCMKKDARTIKIDDSGWEHGCNIPGATRFKLEMSNPSTRLDDYRKLRARVVSALRQGDNAYVHCTAGVHSAAVAAALIRRDLHDEPFETACREIEKVRNVEIQRALLNVGGTWIEEVMQQPLECPPAMELWGASESLSANIFHACRTVKGSVAPLCRKKFSGPCVTTKNVEHFKGKLCVNCATLIPPSMTADHEL